MKTSKRRTMARRMVLGLLVLLALSFTALPSAAVPRMGAPDFVAIDRYIEAQMQAAHVPGIALGIVQGDQIVHLKGFGSADPTGRAVTPHTPFILGSVSKLTSTHNSVSGRQPCRKAARSGGNGPCS